jgi:hypothetical protein
MKNITYTERNGIRYPDLTLPAQTNYPIGKYANLRLEFMEKHRRGAYTTLFTEGLLNEYLHAIDNEIYQNISADEGIVIDENLLMDDVCEFIEKLELVILHKSYNSSKNDN